MAPTNTPSKRPVLRGLALEADGETFEFDVRADAVDALRRASAPGVEAVFRCTWLCQGVPPRYSGDDEWYPDSPADLVFECGAMAVATARGWQCLAGHAHETGVEYYDEDEAVAAFRAGYSVPSTARLMDGRSVLEVLWS